MPLGQLRDGKIPRGGRKTTKSRLLPALVSTKSTSIDWRERKRRTLMACAYASPGAIMVLWDEKELKRRWEVFVMETGEVGGCVCV